MYLLNVLKIALNNVLIKSAVSE